MGLHLKASDEYMTIQFDTLDDARDFVDAASDVLAADMTCANPVDKSGYKQALDSIATSRVLFTDFPALLWRMKLTDQSWAGMSINLPFSVMVLGKLGIL